MFSLLGNPDFLFRCLSGFLLEGMIQNHEPFTTRKSEDSEGIAANIDPNFPNLIRTNQFLEISGGNKFDLFHQLENPSKLIFVCNFFSIGFPPKIGIIEKSVGYGKNCTRGNLLGLLRGQ
uniref:Uncharacterized protein n=1 Tax=Candidatus Kentrum sp. LFY TaxID=2126342 RepID=A0A450UA91_9GAMM|nr:MAG: hypothetical protein BECKLFY1418B_GA0070995_101324 [Candidatus Kentron sp. LFY]VFJ91896.1 MAG: hypothetical protein BECKLFY1418A_GA0070994_101910 [Candidatus Kentron sp. LFY]